MMKSVLIIVTEFLLMLWILISIGEAQTQPTYYTLTGNFCLADITDCTICDGKIITKKLTPGTIITAKGKCNPNQYVVGWDGAGCYGTGSCKITMDANKWIMWVCRPIVIRKLYVEIYSPLSSPGKGNIKSTPPGIDCGISSKKCFAGFNDDSKVVLTATPDANSILYGWRGVTGCTGTPLTCSVSMTKAKIVTVILKKK
jgi:hypothetical protein